jgi:erythromycin esterase
MPTVISTIAFPTTTPRLEDSTIFTKILWLKDNALQVHSISPANEDFSDLQPLKQIIGDKRIVMLGEESHGDGNTFLAKTRLVKFLHQELGFGVIAFESGFYDCHKAWKMIQDGGSTNFAFKGSVFPIWSESSPVQPLISYLDQTKESEHPLILSCFDSQFTGEISNSVLLNDLTVFFKQISGSYNGRTRVA